MSKVYIVSAKRTAVGGLLGSLKTVHPALFGSEVVKNMLEETKVPVADLDEVIVGNVLPAGLGQGIARQISIKAGVPVEVPAYSLNMLCGSGMKSVMNAYVEIKSDVTNLVIAGGVESMTKAPFLMPDKTRSGIKMGEFKMKDHMITDGLWEVFNDYHMGVTAENIVDLYNLTREEQDEFAFNSQLKAIDAIDNGKFKDEIVPIEVKLRRETLTFDTDEHPNRRTNLEKLAKLRPAFKRDGGSVTAGNASGINDGASFVMLASEEAVEKYNLTPLVEIISVGQGGVDPSIMGMGPVPAIKMALKKADMKLSEMQLIELNEAFAAQSLGVVTELVKQHDLSKEEILERTNVNGGAIALGHPIGASGNRILVTLIHEMKKRNDVFGLASLCIGGGMGTAIIVKNVEEK